MAEIRSTVEVPAWYREPTFAGRFLAAAADGVLMFVVGMLLVRLLRTGGTVRPFMLAVTAIYTIGTVALTGRTLGKRLFGLRVADVETGGVPAPGAAVIRWVVPAAPGLLLALAPGGVPDAVAVPLSLAPLVIYWGVLLGPLHRGLHDRAASTVVTARAAE